VTPDPSHPPETRPVRRLIPSTAAEPVEAVYAGLTLPTRPDRPWVALGMVSSIDGAATVGGETAALGGPADHHAFRALRGACDAILVGAGTVRIEGYGPAAGTPARRRDREDRGLAPAPRLVIVSGSLDLDPRARAFSDPAHPPLVVTHAAAPAAQVAALSDVAEVVMCGETEVDVLELLRALQDRGLRRILCEGGPSLNGVLLEADVVDEIFLTVDPVLLAGSAPRIAHGPAPGPRRMRLVELREHEGELLLRYERDRQGGRGDEDGRETGDASDPADGG
jgi:riboflavin-specific deaminase-like protein